MSHTSISPTPCHTIVATSKSEAAAVEVLTSQAQAYLFQQLATKPSAAGLWHHRKELQVEESPMPLHKPQTGEHRHSDMVNFLCLS